MSDAHVGQPGPMLGRMWSEEERARIAARNFNGRARVLRSNGYIYMYAPKHPRAMNGRVPEQVLVAEAAIGRLLADDEVVHHKNGLKADNRPENLQVMAAREHLRLHARERGLGTKVKPEHSQRDARTGRFIRVAGIDFYTKDIDIVRSV